MGGMDGVSSDKARLRSDLLGLRRARSAAALEAARAAVRAQVLKRAAGLACVAAYVPLRTEPGSVELLAELHAGGTSVRVPHMLPDRDLDWVPWTPAGTGSPLGPDAVRDVDLVLAPALAAALDGTRLGRGGGSYDRALGRCGPTAAAVLLFDDEVLDWLPRDPWDVPVHAAVTPSGWIQLGGNTDVRAPG